jgi:hypothetical protein
VDELGTTDFRHLSAWSFEMAQEPPACPPWCVEEPGHSYDYFDMVDGTFSRQHPALVSRNVTLAGFERQRDGVVTHDGPLTSVQAREVAAEIVRAADLCDVIAGDWATNE